MPNSVTAIRGGAIPLPNYLAPVNVTRSTEGDGTAVFATPAANQYYVLDATQLENLSTSKVRAVVKSGTRTLWTRYMVAEGDGLIFDKPLIADLGAAIYVNLSVAVNVEVNILAYLVTVPA